ncbi:MAG: MFS transporter [Chloroflexota bacterium]|nr:MFS transporter [Chloroflexota bacterium]
MAERAAPAVGPLVEEGAAPPVPESPPAPRFVLSLFIFAHFAHHVGTGGLAPLLPLVRDAFALDYARSGLLLSAQGLALGFGQLPISALADRVSKRVMIAVGLIGVGLAGVAISLSTSFVQLIPLLVLTGLMAATYHAPAASFLAETYSALRRGRALGTHVIGGSLAFAVTPAVAIAVVQLTGSWRSAFLALSAAPLAAGTLMLVLSWRARGQAVPRPATSDGADQVSALAALRAIGPLVGIALAEQLLTASMFAFIPLFMVDQHNVPETRAGLFIALITGIGIVAAPIGGALSDRFGRAPVLVAVTASVGPLILLLAYVPYGWPIFLVLAIYGLSMNARLPVLESLFADAVPAARRSTVLGLYYFIGQESSGVATPVVGRLIDATSPVAAFTVLGVLGCVLSLGLLFFRGQLIAHRPQRPA